MDVFRYGNDGKDISVDLFYESENDSIDGIELEVGYGDVMMWCCLPLLWYLAHSMDVLQTLVIRDGQKGELGERKIATFAQ